MAAFSEAWPICESISILVGDSGVDIRAEQDTYQEELQKCLDNDKLSKETYVILKFKGRLSRALKHHLNKQLQVKKDP